MKTTISKTEAQEFRTEYLRMQDEVCRRRAQYQSMRASQHREENEIIQEMFETAAALATPSKAPTAAEIARAMGDKMTRSEVVGQMLVACGEHYNGMGRTDGASHEPTAEMKAREKVSTTTRTRRRIFKEVDESGHLIPGGRSFCQTDRVNGYRVKKG